MLIKIRYGHHLLDEVYFGFTCIQSYLRFNEILLLLIFIAISGGWNPSSTTGGKPWIFLYSVQVMLLQFLSSSRNKNKATVHSVNTIDFCLGVDGDLHCVHQAKSSIKDQVRLFKVRLSLLRISENFYLGFVTIRRGFVYIVGPSVLNLNNLKPHNVRWWC